MTDRDWARLGILYHKWRQEKARHSTSVHERRDEYYRSVERERNAERALDEEYRMMMDLPR